VVFKVELAELCQILTERRCYRT